MWDQVWRNGPNKNFLKAVFHKFYFIHSLILCHIFRTVKGNSQLALETSVYFALISWGRFQTWKCLWILKKMFYYPDFKIGGVQQNVIALTKEATIYSIRKPDLKRMT